MPEADAHPASLHGAMRYTVFGGGKRLRPALVYAGGRLAAVKPDALDPAAAAVELIHAYSLVHDDLPVMDDDDLRHGQPTVHVRFGEATAVLVGDALQALAFEMIASEAEPIVAQRWTQLLANAAGAAGMVGGQVLDLAAEAREEPLSSADLEAMHRRKTGALIRASVMLGASAGTLRDEELEAVDAFARDIGLAFQIHDDVLDVVGTTEELGKPQGSDERQGKTTYVTLLGLAAAKQEGQRRFEHAVAHLDAFGARADDLREIARYVVERTS
ncbi:MAG: polyprenyl synthetase family protein [Gammaproteobacteria bacterium]|nr:polyprenyl synthetase family protein [Gammaproteobacteria bacterium]